MALSSDARIVARVRRGDDAAFAQLHARHAPAILSFCRHLTGNREDAEDAVQHSFLALYKRIVESDGRLDLRPWLFTVARNRCLSLLRARHEGVAVAPDAGTTTSFDGLAAEVERRQELRDLVGDMARLPEPQRAALVLSQLDALSYREIGGVLEVSPEQVKALVFQARSSLASTREARDAPCFEIRRQISDARGAALRRRLLRRHVGQCDGCREFEAIVLRQRREIAILLPVAPSAGLAREILRGALGRDGAATVAAGGGAVGAGTGGGIAGSLGALGAGGAAKLAVVAVVGAGGVAVAAEVPARIQDAASSRPPGSTDRGDPAPTARAPSGEAIPGSGPVAERLLSNGRVPDAAVGDGERGAAERAAGQRGPATTERGAERVELDVPGETGAGEGNGPAAGDDSAPGPGSPPDLPPGLAKREELPPGLAKRDELPPGLAKRGATPPGQAGKPAGGNGNGGGGGNGNGNSQAPASPGGGNGQSNGNGGNGNADGGSPESPGSGPVSGGGPPSGSPGNGNGGQGNSGAGNGNGGQGNGAGQGNGGGNPG